MGYTGRKLVKYIWIPKSKTFFREYRDFLKVCHAIQERDGSFSDKSVGAEMVARGAIVDRDSTADSYIEKYKDETIGNQSYVSNARMMIRILRWLGFITKDADTQGVFYLTPYGENLIKFRGPFPAVVGELNEKDFFEQALAMMRYYSVNDDIRYRSSYFRQRVFYNLINCLGAFGYATHYELALSALVLKDESKKEYDEKIGRILDCRNKGKNIRWLMDLYGMDCDDKSAVTGIYDGPKVLLGFAKQLGLVETVAVKDLGDSVLEMYKEMYKDGGNISSKSIKTLSVLTSEGKKFVKKYKDLKLIWFEDLKDQILSAALIIICQKHSLPLKKLKEISVNIASLDMGAFNIDKNYDLVIANNIDFDLYRDVPYEKRDAVIKRIKEISPKFFDSFIKADSKIMHYCHNNYSLKSCLDCHLGKCGVYRDKVDVPGSTDRFASRVCPDNLIDFDSYGVMSINSGKCVSCGLCAIRCPFSGISYDSGLIFRKLKQEKEIFIGIQEEEKEKWTQNLENKGLKFDPIIKLDDIPKLLKRFLNEINRPGKKWNKDQCYAYVRNVFRIFKCDVSYSGSGGMKRRSDVTVEKPFIVGTEVKSPSESPVNLKAVRQAFDAGIQLETDLVAAIGISLHRGAIEQEMKYYKAKKGRVALMELRYLAFLLYVSEYVDFQPDSLKRLLIKSDGALTLEKFSQYLLDELSLCNSSLGKYDLESLIKKSLGVAE